MARSGEGERSQGSQWKLQKNGKRERGGTYTCEGTHALYFTVDFHNWGKKKERDDLFAEDKGTT